MNITLPSGTQLPVDPKFNPVCGFNQTGKPVNFSFTSDSLKVSVTSAALPTGAATEATLAAIKDKTTPGLRLPEFDKYEIAYVGTTNNINTIIYSLAGETVATLTFAYVGGAPTTDDARVISVTKA